MNIKYYAADGAIKSLGDNELAHYKYIKKIKTGNGYRYFYSQDEIDAFNKEVQDKWRYAKPQKPSTMQKKIRQDSYEEQRRWTNENARLSETRKKIMTDDYKNISDYKSGEKSWDEYHSDREKIRKRIRKESDDWSKNYDRHKEEEEKISKRFDNYKRYEKVVNTPQKTIKSASKKVDRGRSAVEKRLNKAKKTAKNEAKGVKRASDAIRGKGDYSYDGHDTNPKSYWKYDKKKKRSTKVGKTGKIERQMIGAYRRTHPYE